MDAAQTLRKFSLLFALAGAALMPHAAQAQASLLVNGVAPGSATINGNNAVCVNVTSSDGTTSITFNVTGAPAWLQAPGSNYTGTYTTPAQLCFDVANDNYSPNPATLTLTATAPVGATGTTISVTENPNGTGTGTNTYLSVTPTSMSFTTAGGVQQSQNLYVTNATANPVSYQLTQLPSWLTVTGGLSGGTIPSGQQFTIQLTANASNLAQNTYTSSIAITNPGPSLVIPVYYNVLTSYGSGNGTGGGTLTFSPSPASLSYNTGGSIPTANVSVLGSSASTFNASVQTNPSNFLLIGQGGSGCGQSAIYSAPVSTGLVVCTSNALYSLPTGLYTGTVLVTDAYNATGTLTVNLSVNGGTTSSNGLSVSSNSISLNAAYGSTTSVQQSLNVTSTTSGTLSVGYTGTGITASLASNTIVANQPVILTIYGNPTSLPANTYNGTVTVTENNVGSVATNVSFVVGSGSGGGTTSSTIVAPSTLTFDYETGVGMILSSQQVTLSASGTYTAAVTYTAGQTTGWLSVAPTSGTGPSYPSISASPAGLTAGTYTGQVTFTTGSGTGVVNVTLNVTTTTVLYSYPTTLNFYIDQNSPLTYFTVNTSDGSPLGTLTAAVSGNNGWLSVAAAGNSVEVQTNTSSLANGIYTAYISVASTTVYSTPLIVPVVLTVTGSTVTTGNLTLSTSALNLSAQPYGSSVSTTITVTPPSGTSFSAGASVISGGSNWLSISPSGGSFTAAETFTVTASPAGLAANTYNGTLTFSSSNGTQQSVPVTFVVSTTANGGAITVSPTSMSFSYTVGGSNPASQGLSITNAVSGTSPITFTVSTTTQNNGSWLSTSAGSTTGGTPETINVTVNPTGLQPATYNGSVVVTPSGGTPVTVPVTLVVQGLPTVSASPTALTLAYTAGGTAPTGTIQVTGTAASLNFTATAASTGNWLTVTPTSGNTGAGGTTLQVGVNTAGLTANTYIGTVTVAGTNGSTGSSTVTVTLNVTAPLPTISAVVNAASFASGAVAPGEIVTLGGAAMGPSTPAYLQTDTAGANVLTTLGGVQVLFSGIPAPLIYVSATQINCVVPYGIAGVLSPYVQVKYLGQGSNAYPLNPATTMPGIFTQNGQGSGPGAIVNQSGSINSPSNPAPKGSTVVIYMTGEGQTSPAGVTGKVTCAPNTACVVSQIPVPLLPVSVLINGAPASYSFAGEAPGFVSGVLQINVQVPANAPTGNLPLVVSIGPNSSQQNVTVSVQ